MNAMAEEKGAQHVDVGKIKAALVTAGVIKSATLSAQDEKKITDELARYHIDRLKLSFQIICHSSHYCFIVRGLN